MGISLFKNTGRRLAKAENYQQWRVAAMAYDSERGLDCWKNTEKSRRYDYASIRARLDLLRKMRIENDNHGLLFSLNEGLHGNMDGIGQPSLYSKAKFGTKQLITDYVDEIVWALEHIASPEVDDISVAEKREFFHRASHCFGSTALMLSGAGTLLYFHLGVVKALMAEGILPNILAGSSGGAFVCAFLGTHTDEELIHLLVDNEAKKSKKGYANILVDIGAGRLSPEKIEKLMEDLIPDLTFQEALELSGRHINVSIAAAEKHQTSRLLNATTSPNVYIREAVMASSAVPGFFPPVTLAAKNAMGEKQPYIPSRQWVDGSVSDDVPSKRLARLYGVNHFVVSQVNPLVLPFVRDSKSQHGVLSELTKVTQHTLKEILNSGAKILYRPLSKLPVLNSAVTLLNSVASQDYTGDINIFPEDRFHNPFRLLTLRDKREAQALVFAGEKATWPKIEIIRTCTKVSKVLYRILGEYP